MVDRDIIFIRASRVGYHEEQLARQLEPVFGKGNVAFCVDESRGVVDTGPWPKSVLTQQRVRHILNAPPPHDWGWRMGDLCHIAISEDFGPRPAQWLIENDVHISIGREKEIFNILSQITADFMACDLQKKKVKPIAEAVTVALPTAEWGCVFAFNRLSGPRIHELRRTREQIAAGLVGTTRKTPNDEAVLANLGMTAGWEMVNLYEVAPKIFARPWFATNPPMLREALDKTTVDHIHISHPVLTYEQIYNRVAQPFIDGHPQQYKVGRLSRILAVLPKEKQEALLKFYKENEK